MSTIEDAHLIVIDKLSDERREVVHELVKAKASDWWHNMPNVWIAGGKTSSFWREELYPVISGTGGTILVTRLPAFDAGRTWSLQGPNASEKARWLHETYTPSSD